MPVNDLEKNIIATLCFYDLFDKPLTNFELYKYLINYSGHTNQNLSFFGLIEVLKNNHSLKKIIDFEDGFYYFKDKKNIVRERIKKEKVSINKWRKTKKVAKILQKLPYVKMVGITGSLAINNTKSLSDLDFFIVVKASRIWLGRLIATLVIHLSGQRRYGQKIKDRACLNSYIADQSLKIETRDLYSASEYFHLIPLVDYNIYIKFKKANSWIGKYFLFPKYDQSKNQRIITSNSLFSPLIEFLEYILDNKIGDRIEQFVARYQKRRIIRNPATNWQNSQIIFNDKCLIFHPIPKAPVIKKGYEANLKRYSAILNND